MPLKNATTLLQKHARMLRPLHPPQWSATPVLRSSTATEDGEDGRSSLSERSGAPVCGAKEDEPTIQGGEAVAQSLRRWTMNGILCHSRAGGNPDNTSKI